MHSFEKTPIPEQLLRILEKSSTPLSGRELGVRLRIRGIKISEYEITKLLRELQRNGQAAYHRGRWVSQKDSITSQHQNSAITVCSDIHYPPLSPELLHILGWEKQAPGALPGEGEPHPPQETPTLECSFEKPMASISRWDNFRKFLGYYRHCIVNEEGAEASTFHNEYLKKFLFLRGIGSWYPKPKLTWRATVLLGPHMAEFLRNLDGHSEGYALVLGYPLQGIYLEKEGQPDVGIVSPIFFYYVRHRISAGALIVECENPQPDINLKWLEHAFGRNPQRQRSFLSACGFLNRWQPNDEIPTLEKGERSPGLDNLAATISSYMPERVVEPLRLESVPDTPLSDKFPTGIYNRAVLMLARRTKYTKTLLKELQAIEKTPDDELDKTALRYIFIRDDAADKSMEEELLHEGLVVDTAPLNPDQRRAVAALLKRNISVITGPPGTGKSQVVSAAMGNARLMGQSVLFASRNHKAIDAVFNRFTDVKQRPLMVRTNSKDDPNLNYTFRTAIRELLALPHDPIANQRLVRIKEEIHSLLENRGSIARYARSVAEVATLLGEKEEQLAYLAKTIPDTTKAFIDENPKAFPVGTVKRLIKVIHGVNLGEKKPKFVYKILGTFKAFNTLFWYLIAKGKLRRIPGYPPLPILGTPSTLRNLIRSLQIIEKSLEFAELRLSCLPLESRAKEMPRLEELSDTISQLSSRIAKLAIQAISYDLDSRCGLPPDANREELDALQAAMHSVQTGLETGVVKKETLRLLKSRASLVLDHFPCWAVTNLSVGSRIPFVPGLFDLAIVDEASQSDIPSAIPILFRARRIGVVGDPFQLTHCSKLSITKDTMLRRKAGLSRIEDVRFAYTESSLYNLISRINGVESVFLSETYRSVSDIANYSNQTFYSGRLRVATNQKHLLVPRGMKPGIHWTDVKGGIQSGGGSGCYCPEEVEKVVALVKTILLDSGFQGTLGIVTPFRQQANRLQDAIFQGDIDYQLLERAGVHVDTAHGFQGDERDVIILSLCAGPEMPIGSRSFLRETGNLFNVAASRARAVLHIVGNRDWAQTCGIKHIQNLAAPPKLLRPEPKPSPWYPHESPWEKILFDALTKEGLEPKPQFPVLNRRLDLALIGKTDKTLKIDIEVDGDCHRNPDGSRKIDDIWRDMQLQAMGWKVMRFWVYQLREDLDGCVKEIMEAYGDNER